MADVTTVGTFLDSLREDLAGMPELARVAVYTGPVDHLSIGQECIVFAVDPESVSYEYQTVPQLEVWESYDVVGKVWVVKAGSGEPVIKATRDRCLELIGHVHEELALNNTTTAASQAAYGVNDSRITGWTLEQFVIDGGRDCRVSFTVHVTARFTPG
jgi:hypothetical protein